MCERYSEATGDRRADTQLLRLSICYALLDGTAGVDVPHLEAAHAVWAYCRASAAYIFSDASGDPDADRLHDALLEAGEAGLNGNQQHRLFTGHRSAGALARARAASVEKGWAVEAE